MTSQLTIFHNAFCKTTRPHYQKANSELLPSSLFSTQSESWLYLNVISNEGIYSFLKGRASTVARKIHLPCHLQDGGVITQENQAGWGNLGRAVSPMSPRVRPPKVLVLVTSQLPFCHPEWPLVPCRPHLDT